MSIEEFKRRADRVNKSLDKTVSNLETIVNVGKKPLSTAELSKRIVSAYRGGQGL